MGLSPLARGNQSFAACLLPTRGPIPARAGQPRCPRPAGPRTAAYPRSRGATAIRTARSEGMTGLSPLARGNLEPLQLVAQGDGPIPARAGQPFAACSASFAAWAYPRSRGATCSGLVVQLLFAGLSPLARGNLEQLQSFGAGQGPIPARAGQPAVRPCACAALWAYPRSRGATRSWAVIWPGILGLSPLARGNRPGLGSGAPHRGPIPARAGQPQPGQAWRVWPGPIPARAGQPSRIPCLFAATRAYPRSRGATQMVPRSQHRHAGLSPLARGNPT